MSARGSPISSSSRSLKDASSVLSHQRVYRRFTDSQRTFANIFFGPGSQCRSNAGAIWGRPHPLSWAAGASRSIEAPRPRPPAHQTATTVKKRLISVGAFHASRPVSRGLGGNRTARARSGGFTKPSANRRVARRVAKSVGGWRRLRIESEAEPGERMAGPFWSVSSGTRDGRCQ